MFIIVSLKKHSAAKSSLKTLLYEEYVRIIKKACYNVKFWSANTPFLKKWSQKLFTRFYCLENKICRFLNDLTKYQKNVSSHQFIVSEVTAATRRTHKVAKCIGCMNQLGLVSVSMYNSSLSYWRSVYLGGDGPLPFWEKCHPSPIHMWTPKLKIQEVIMPPFHHLSPSGGG